MIASRGRGGGHNSRGGCSGRGGCPHCTYCKRMGHTQENCYSLHGFPDKVAQVSRSEKAESKFSDEEYQEYLKLKSERPSNQAQSSSVPCFSTACISQSIEGPSPWILDSGASDHISGNKSSFSSFSLPKIPHLVTVANGSKVASQGSGQVSLSPSLKLNSVLFLPQCPYNLISLSQLTRSLNCSVTFTANSFVIQEHGTGRLIGEGRESRGLYYLESSFPVSCFASSKPKILHDRLGHPSLSKLKIMVPSLKNLIVLDCESC